MENEFRFLEFEGIQVAAFIEAHNKGEYSSYFPSNILFYVQQGQLNIRSKHQLTTISAGNFCIIRKYSDLYCFKTWTEKEEYAIVYAMSLKDDFIKEAIKAIGYKIPVKSKNESIVDLGQNAILLGLYQSLSLYIAENQEPDKHLMFLKTKEAILGIIKSNPDHLALFYDFSKPVKAGLQEFMNHHRLSVLPLEELATLSGRSLSTFNRDFKKVFNISPHRWRLAQRLDKAHEMLTSTTKKSSDIYLELGFKDLAHFSRAFKKAFGIPPSLITKRLRVD